jgi:hypothetical protein
MDKNFGDDFEFKPITEGLGFHKKTIDLREDASLPLKTGILPKSRAHTDTKSAAQTHAPAGPTTFNSMPHTATERALHNPWAPSLKDKTIIEKERKPQLASENFVPIAVNWPAALFDAAMILGLGLLFSAVVFALTKIDLSELISMLKDEGGAQIATLLLIVAVFEIYCVTCRSFFGKTLGEWAFDCRLGLPQEQMSLLYPIKVAWRTLVIALTGFICLPILSTILDQDVAGLLSGVMLQSEKL